MNINPMFDQADQLLKDFAPVLMRYYQALLLVGFKDEQAIILVAGFQNTMFMNSKSS
jgi:hypothetical protein